MSTSSGATILSGVPTNAEFGAFLTSRIAAASAAPNKPIGLLNGAALPPERAGIKAYQDAAAINILSPGVLGGAKRIPAYDRAHLGALDPAASAADATPSTDLMAFAYPPALSKKDRHRFAETPECAAKRADLPAFTVLQDKTLVRAAASILRTETMHVASLIATLGEGPIADFSADASGFVDAALQSECHDRQVHN